MAKSKIEFKCEKCGKPQPKNKEKSNKNWSVFDSKKECACGGKFQMYIDGVLLGGDSNA